MSGIFFVISQAIMQAQIPSTNMAVRSTDITISASPTVNSPMTYTVKVYNLGSLQATNVTLMASLPPSLWNPMATPPAGGSCSVSCVGSGAQSIVTCSMGSVSGSSYAQAAITATPTVAGAVASLFSVAANEFDTDISNNSVQITTTINAEPLPTISGLNPGHGSTNGGDSVLISGSNFKTGATVTIDGASATVLSVNVPGQITVRTPGHSPGSNFLVQVTNPGPPPLVGPPFTGFTYQCPSITLSPTSLPQATLGTSYSQTITASGGSGPHTFAITSGTQVPGLSLSSTGVLSGTPSVSGSFSFTVTATDTWSCTGNRSYTLTVVAPPPAISSISPTSGSTNGGTPVTINGSGFQAGARVNFGTSPASVGSISPTQIAATSPGHIPGTVVVTVTNPDGQTSVPFTGFTYQCPTITVLPASLPAAAAGTSYSQTITGSGGTGPYTFLVTSGALPPGLALSAAGVLSGTPSSAGNFTFTVTATDALGCAGSANYSLTVSGPPSLVSITVNPTSVCGGSSAVGTATLNVQAPAGGVTVALSTDSDLGTVPPSVTVPMGAVSADFLILTQPITPCTISDPCGPPSPTSQNPVTIYGTYAGVSQSTTLTVIPSWLADLSINPLTASRGSSATGTVTLTRAAPSGRLRGGGMVVLLTSSDPQSASVPASIAVPAGASSAAFTVTTYVGGTSSTVTITATVDQCVAVATLNLTP